MFDSKLQPYINPTLEMLANMLRRFGLTADMVSFASFGLGMLAVPFIATGMYHVGVVLIILNRLGDGVDGAMARMTSPTDRGGYIDIVFDFLFYSAIPLAFAFADPGRNALAAAFLLFAFVGTGTTFLAYAIFAAKYGVIEDFNPARGKKGKQSSFYYLGGLTEGTETVVFLVLVGVFPGAFATLAWIFGLLCLLTTATRIYDGWNDFPGNESSTKKSTPEE